MSLFFWLQGTLRPLIHAVASELSVFMVLTNQGFTSKRSATPKILYCTVCANGSFAEVKMGIEPLLGEPFVCGFQSTWKHSWGEDPLTPSPVFCPQDHSASHSIIKGNSKFRNFKFQANPKHAKYFCISVINSAHRDCFKNPEGFLNTEGLQAHLVALIEFPDEKLASIIEFYGSEFWCCSGFSSQSSVALSNPHLCYFLRFLLWLTVHEKGRPSCARHHVD